LDAPSLIICIVLNNAEFQEFKAILGLCMKTKTLTQKINGYDERKRQKSKKKYLQLVFFSSMVLWKQPKLSVNRRHSSTFSGDTKSSATFKQD
jgi:hypothetical protein